MRIEFPSSKFHSVPGAKSLWVISPAETSTRRPMECFTETVLDSTNIVVPVNLLPPTLHDESAGEAQPVTLRPPTSISCTLCGIRTLVVVNVRKMFIVTGLVVITRVLGSSLLYLVMNSLFKVWLPLMAKGFLLNIRLLMLRLRWMA